MFIRVVIFYVSMFVITMLLGGGQQAIGLNENAAILPQLAPGLAALLMVLVFRKDDLQLSFFDRTIRVRRYLLAAAIPLGGALVAYLITGFVSGGSVFRVPEAVPWSLLIWFPLGALGEETGWRGYLHKRLDRSLSGLVSSIIVGALWALWHVSIYANGPIYVAFFILLMVSYSIVINALIADNNFNIIIAAIFHLMINVTNMVSFNLINTLEFIVTNSLVWAGIAVVIVFRERSVFLKKGSLSESM
jgi:membrane protease YdiL (CAAX protease family)